MAATADAASLPLGLQLQAPSEHGTGAGAGAGAGAGHDAEAAHQPGRFAGRLVGQFAQHPLEPSRVISDDDVLVRADDDVRDPLRVVDGLRGLHPLPHREEHLRGRNNIDSVVEGLGATAKVITAVAVDATIVRMILVPATMALVGEANWWLPRWLDRLLPHIDVEGDGDAVEGTGRDVPCSESGSSIIPELSGSSSSGR